MGPSALAAVSLPQPPGDGCLFAAAHSRGVNSAGVAATSAGEARSTLRMYSCSGAWAATALCKTVRMMSSAKRPSRLVRNRWHAGAVVRVLILVQRERTPRVAGASHVPDVETPPQLLVGHQVHRVRLDRQGLAPQTALAKQCLQQITEAAQVAPVQDDETARVVSLVPSGFCRVPFQSNLSRPLGGLSHVVDTASSGDGNGRRGRPSTTSWCTAQTRSRSRRCGSGEGRTLPQPPWTYLWT